MPEHRCGTCRHYFGFNDWEAGECRWAERRADRDWPMPSYMAVYPTDGVMCQLWLAQEIPTP
jgi:hypothetical protein